MYNETFEAVFTNLKLFYILHDYDAILNTNQLNGITAREKLTFGIASARVNDLR